jgi:hypothetical protein
VGNRGPQIPLVLRISEVAGRRCDARMNHQPGRPPSFNHLMSIFGQCPIWVLKRPDGYLTDNAGWILAFTTPGKAITYAGRQSSWQCKAIAPDQMLLLIADLHEAELAGLRLNPAIDTAAIGRRLPIETLAAGFLGDEAVA